MSAKLETGISDEGILPRLKDGLRKAFEIDPFYAVCLHLARNTIVHAR